MSPHGRNFDSPSLLARMQLFRASVMAFENSASSIVPGARRWVRRGKGWSLAWASMGASAIAAVIAKVDKERFDSER